MTRRLLRRRMPRIDPRATCAPAPKLNTAVVPARSRTASLNPLRRLTRAISALALLAVAPGCKDSSGANATRHQPYGYEVVNSWPHDPRAFTQGLVFNQGVLLESTGLNGQSSLRRVDLTTGRVLQRVNLPQRYFGEGMTVLGGRIYQLTWQNQTGFIYDLSTFDRLGEFSYRGEGWGLTTDGKSLILSDGTAELRFLDPDDFEVTRTLPVTLDGRPLRMLNELEFIEGEIFANIWQTDFVARIDPATGMVTGMIDFTGLLPPAARPPGTDVLNGIAYDPAEKRIFVTGKNWPRLFEVKFQRK